MCGGGGGGGSGGGVGWGVGTKHKYYLISNIHVHNYMCFT